MNSIQPKQVEQKEILIENPKEETLDEVRKKLADIAVATMRKIESDHQYRVHNAKKYPTLLDKGLFYPNEYFTLLKGVNNESSEKKLKLFKNLGSFYHGYTQKFKLMENPFTSPTGYSPMFEIKKDTKATEALESIIEELTLTGCGETCSIAWLEALRQYWGNDRFNELLSADSPFPLNISNLGLTFLSIFQKAKYYESQIEKGDIVLFKNAKKYREKHLHFGEGNGFNVLCENDKEKKYIGLGASSEALTTETKNKEVQGIDKKELDQILINEYNKKPFDVKEMLSEKAAKNYYTALSPDEKKKAQEVDKLKNKTLDLKEFHSDEGGTMEAILTFDVKKVKQIKDATLKVAIALIKQWKKEVEMAILSRMQ